MTTWAQGHSPVGTFNLAKDTEKAAAIARVFSHSKSNYIGTELRRTILMARAPVC